MKKALLLLKISFFILGFAAVLLYFYVLNILQTPITVDDPKLVQIESGASLAKIARTLRQNGLIEKDFYFIF